MKMLKFVIINLLSLITASLAFGQKSGPWRMQPVAIQTRWAKMVSPSSVLPEYPRPQMVRRGVWQNLNGLWEYAISNKDLDTVEWAGEKILVPYPLESALSGVKKMLNPNEALWYKRNFSYHLTNGKRTILHFGAVDYKAKVIVNGQEVGSHEGGYTPFYFDITKIVKNGDNQIILKVEDPSNQGVGPHGKQVLEPSNMYYTPSSGIWQTVWLETVPVTFINSLKITPAIDEQLVRIKVNLIPETDSLSTGTVTNINPSEFSIEAVAKDGNIVVNSCISNPSEEIRLPIKRAHLWTPSAPFLYELNIKLKKNGKVVDEVGSYFAMRKVSIHKDAKGVERIYLNNKYTYNLGVLDQGFWPEGLYTAPTDEALMFDVKVIKEMGFNTIRKHIKIEPARWYYHCDKLGMLVWQDFVNPNQTLPEGAKQAFEAQIQETIEQLYNFPCITTWVIFNEKWGQYDQERITKWVKRLDSSRLVNGHSGELLYVNNQLRSPSKSPYVSADMTDVHSYPFPRNSLLQAGKARVLGEFGGIGLPVDGHLWNDIVMGWGYDGLVTQGLMRKQYTQMVDSLKILQKDGLSGSIYTQPYDVESEQNGLLTYDREIIKLPINVLQGINARLWPSTINKLNTKSEIVVKTFEEVVPDYAALVKEYENGRRDSAFLRRFTILANSRKDTPMVNSAFRDYFAVIKDPQSELNLLYIENFTRSRDDVGFKYIVQQANELADKSSLGKRCVEKVKKIISSEVRSQIFAKKFNGDLPEVGKEVRRRYGSIGEEVFLQNEALLYYLKKDMCSFVNTKNIIHKKYPEVTSIFDMNNDAWAVFINSDDPDLLRSAIEWSKKVVEKEPTGAYYDTYANLLYKLGRKDDAIALQKKGLQLEVGNGDKEEILGNLEKMLRNMPTWK